MHALEARTGKSRRSFPAGGAIRTRPTVAAGALYVQADDGFLYKLAATTGDELWRVRIVTKAVERLPFDNPKSRFDRFGSDVTVTEGRLYVGTHDGKVLALEPSTAPAARWSGASLPPRRPRERSVSQARWRWGRAWVFATGLDGRVYAFAE